MKSELKVEIIKEHITQIEETIELHLRQEMRLKLKFPLNQNAYDFNVQGAVKLHREVLMGLKTELKIAQAEMEKENEYTRSTQNR